MPQGWCLAQMSDLFIVNPKNKLEDAVEAGFVPMGLVDDGYSGNHSYERRPWGEIKKGYCHFTNGDIAVAKISPCFENRKSTIFKRLPNGVGAGTTELVILRGEQLFSQYFLYLFKSDWYIAQGTKYFKGVVGQQRVNKEIFTSLNVAVPPYNEQVRIVTQIQQLFKLFDIMTENL